MQGLVKLGDFGVATNLQETDIGIQDVVGTPYWMAPEVIEMREVTAASDIWSVGCLVMELITGHPPYYELQPMSALFRIVQVFCPRQGSLGLVITASQGGMCLPQAYWHSLWFLPCAVQDSHPVLPEGISQYLEDFLLACFQKVGSAGRMVPLVAPSDSQQ